MDTVAFLVVYWLFSVGYLLYLTGKKVRKRLQKEWWLTVQAEGESAPAASLLEKVPTSEGRFIVHGEPRTWWQERLKEPKAKAVLAQMKHQNVGCCMTNSRIELTGQGVPHYKVKQWQILLNESPPTASDWKNSQAGFFLPAKDKTGLAAQSGAPVLVSPLRDAERL